MEGMNSKEDKPFYKKVWFWVVVVIVAAVVGAGGAGGGNTANKQGPATNTTQQQTDDKELDGITFNVSDVRNDVTGNWRKAVISENIEMKDYALDYYRKFFKSDDEIHGIVNFYTKTTTKIALMSDSMLDVCVYEYVDQEEHDAKKLFSGMVLSEYSVNKNTGKVKKIR